jgi:hypothetical protein
MAKSKPTPLGDLTPGERQYVKASQAKAKRDAARAHVVLARARGRSRFVQAPAGRSGRVVKSSVAPHKVDARELVKSLRGKPLATLSGRPNMILDVSSDTVLVATNRSPEGKPVPISWVQSALDRLMRDGEVEISVESVGYRSAFVGAVLSQVPGAIAGAGSVRMEH